MGGVGNGAAEEDWCWDLNPGAATMPGVGTTWLWVAPFCHAAYEAGKTLLGRKGVKGLLLVGPEKVPHGSGLTGDCGGDTADGAGSLNQRLLLLFLRYGTLDWAKGRRKDCMRLWVF